MQKNLVQDETDLSLKEWALKAKLSHGNKSSRRFSESNLKSFRENARSFRSNATISSTASSPGYPLKGEFDPSTYSFTTALKALQAKTVYTWEYMSPEGLGLTLSSKWNDAERYICNPLSKQYPLECLSAKTLSGRSFPAITTRITMSTPLIYSSSSIHQTHRANSPISEHESKIEITSKVKRSQSTRDVGVQSPVQTPSMEERPIEISDSSLSSQKLESITEVQVRETRKGQCTKRNGGEERKKQIMMLCRLGGCLSIKDMWHKQCKNTKQLYE